MAFFALITGYFFYVAVVFFVQRNLQSTMMGQSVPMNVDEWVVRNVLSNVSVVGLFLIPMITMRLFAEEKRTGTIELLMTSPISNARHHPWENGWRRWCCIYPCWPFR